MKRKRIQTGLLAIVLGAGVTARGEFIPGRLYVSASSSGEPACFEFGDPEAIVEIDPSTGEMRVFAISDDHDMCIPSRLRFAPDGQTLLQLNYWQSKVLAFSPDGTSEVLLDASDGLNSPMGSNGLAFDAHENLYVVNRFGPILRFPADGALPAPFTNFGNGALDFAPNGDLFYSNPGSGSIIRINPQGKWFSFDVVPGSPSSLGFDGQGNLFVGSSGNIFRYDDGDPGARRLLATGFLSFSGQANPMAISPDGNTVYYADALGILYAVDAQDGGTTIVADLAEIPELWLPWATGITVYVPTLPGDMDADGDVDPQDFAIFDACFTAPGGEASGRGCQAADMDADGDVDWLDFAGFQIVFSKL